VNKIIFLKDIELSQKSVNEKVYKFSDFYGNRKQLIKLLSLRKSDEFVFKTNDFFKTRWCLIYVILLFINPTNKKYIIDNSGTYKVNFFFLIKFLINVLFSIFIQLIFFFLYFIFLFILLLIPKRKQRHEKLQSLIFYRSNPVFDLTAGGSLGHIIGIINGFIENNIDVSFIGIDRISGLRNDIRINLINPRKYLFSFPVFSSMETSIRNVIFIYFKNYLNKSSQSAIYYRITAFDITPLILNKVFKLPLIVEFNSFLEWEHRNNGERYTLKMKFISYIENLILKNASLIVCVSDELKNQLIKRGFCSKKVFYCSNGVDVNKFEDLKVNKILSKSLKLDNHKVIGFVGTFGPWHGIDLLCESIIDFNKNNLKHEVKFLLVGDGSLRKFAEDNLTAFDNVVFTGKVHFQDITDYLNLCDILISPHKLPSSEKVFIGSPTKLFEYLAMKKIVIGTDLGQIKEIISPAIDFTKSPKNIKITKQEVGIITSQTPSSLAESINFALENFDKLEFLKENSYRKVISEYTWKKKVNLILNTFYESYQ